MAAAIAQSPAAGECWATDKREDESCRRFQIMDDPD